LDQSMAASGTFPMEPMKVKKATTGATAAFSSTARKEGDSVPAPRKSAFQKLCGTNTEMNPAMVKPKRISL
jgi:hypothetical protein